MAVDLELPHELPNAGAPRRWGVTVTLPKDWFQMHTSRNTKPAALTVKRYWALLEKPLDNRTAIEALCMMKRALIDWPKMGAAIGKLAHEKFKMEKQANRQQRRRARRSAKAALKDSVLDVTNVVKTKRGAEIISSHKKSCVKLHRRTKKVMKK